MNFTCAGLTAGINVSGEAESLLRRGPSDGLLRAVSFLLPQLDLLGFSEVPSVSCVQTSPANLRMQAETWSNGGLPGRAPSQLEYSFNRGRNNVSWVKIDERRPWANTWFRNRLMALAESAHEVRKFRPRIRPNSPPLI